ncbi:MAG: hypothetical protein ABIN89_13075 [Chitinophagaceae bacterium]
MRDFYITSVNNHCNDPKAEAQIFGLFLLIKGASFDNITSVFVDFLITQGFSLGKQADFSMGFSPSFSPVLALQEVASAWAKAQKAFF